MRKRFHYGWVIVLCALLIQGGSTGIFMNCVGVILSAVTNDLKFRAGDLSIYYFVRYISSAIAVGYCSRLFFKYSPRHMMALYGLLASVSFGMMYFFHRLWQWYVSAIFTGIGIASTPIILPVLINNWFRKHNGLVLGLVMSSAGILGTIYNPICGWLITQYGWRITAVITALLGFCMMSVVSLLFLWVTPEEKQLQPYGTSEQHSTTQNTFEPTIMPSPKIFYLCLFAYLTPVALVQFNQFLPLFTQSIGYTLQTGALLTSCSMIGNLLGKICIGAFADRFGIYSAFLVFHSTTILSLFILWLGSKNLVMLYGGGLLFGLTFATFTTLAPLLFRDLYGEKQYRHRLSIAQSMNNITSAIVSVIFPYLFDFTGSFQPVFIGGLVCVTITIGIYLYLKQYSKQIHIKQSY